jgi:hypothetical protein
MRFTAIRLLSALKLAVTAMSEGLTAPLEACRCHLGTILTVLHPVLAEYVKPSIVYIFSFPVEIMHWQSSKLQNVNNDVFSIL